MEVIAGNGSKGRLRLKNNVVHLSDRRHFNVREVTSFKIVDRETLRNDEGLRETVAFGKLGYLTSTMIPKDDTVTVVAEMELKDGSKLLVAGSGKEMRELQVSVFDSQSVGSAPTVGSMQVPRSPSWRSIALIALFGMGAISLIAESIQRSAASARLTGCYSATVSVGEKPGAGMRWDEFDPRPDIVVRTSDKTELASCRDSYVCQFDIVDPLASQHVTVEDADAVFWDLIGEGNCSPASGTCELEPAATLTFSPCEQSTIQAT